MSLNIKPLDDRVVVEPLAADEKTASGIILPDTAQEKPQQGTVVVVGPGKACDKETCTCVTPMSVKKGDKVLYGNILVLKLSMKARNCLL